MHSVGAGKFGANPSATPYFLGRRGMSMEGSGVEGSEERMGRGCISIFYLTQKVLHEKSSFSQREAATRISHCRTSTS